MSRQIYYKNVFTWGESLPYLSKEAAVKGGSLVETYIKTIECNDPDDLEMRYINELKRRIHKCQRNHK